MHTALVSSRVGFSAVSIGVVTLAAGAAGPSGDNPGSCLPLVIGAQTGSTVGLTDDSNETCPYSGSTSPDAYYCFTPSTTTDLSLDLCESAYDTQVYVYDSNLSLVPLPDRSGGACNDDACSSSGGGGFRSFLSCVRFTGGAPYYVVVDGWQGDAGAYTLVVGTANPADCLPPGDCIVECPPGGTLEGEPCDFGDTAPNDLYNGGCNCTDPAGCFQDVECGDVICGQGYFDGSFRDTDWFAMDISGLGAITIEVMGLAEFPAVTGRVDTDAMQIFCSGIPLMFAELVITDECEPAVFTTAEHEGETSWFFLACDFSAIVDCNVTDPGLIGPDYVLSLSCSLGCPLDLDDSGDVGFGDLLLILSNWGPCP